MILEMEEAMRALGKASLKELSADDLVALDSLSAEITGVRSVLQEPMANQRVQKIRKQMDQRKSRSTLKDLGVAGNNAENQESNTALDKSLVEEHIQLIKELKEENKLMWRVIDTYIKSPFQKKIELPAQKKKHLIANYKNYK